MACFPHWSHRVFASLVLLGLVAGVLIWRQEAAPQATVWQEAAVERGDLQASVSATGTIEPEEVVDIGAQVVGMIKEFGRDPRDSSKPIDYLSQVAEGTVLARIDDALYQIRVDRAATLVEQAQARIAQARADVRRAEANVLESQARFRQVEQDWQRAMRLLATKAMSQEDYDAKQASYGVAQANLRVAAAAVDQAKANEHASENALEIARAEHREARQNLDYTIIRSPVKGVIIDRRVNVGQTVISSLNAPSLFLIAKDLKRLQIWASVNEADIGRIRPGQAVRFTVDAYPDEVFAGQVNQVRLNATMTQNVVTYTVVVDTDNSSGRLLPYLTASLEFEVGSRRNVMLAPSAALRWRPQPDQIAPDARQTAPAATTTRADHGVVWVAAGRYVRPVTVRLGLSDGLHAEILEGGLSVGGRVVVGEHVAADSERTSSPFAPQLGGGRR